VTEENENFLKLPGKRFTEPLKIIGEIDRAVFVLTLITQLKFTIVFIVVAFFVALFFYEFKSSWKPESLDMI
jgi:hypothetical protein